MPRSRAIVFVALVYLALITTGLLMPKAENTGTESTSWLSQAFHFVFYAPTTLDVISNTLLFIPGMLILIFLFPKVGSISIFALCSIGSVTTELLQLKIPGRVSSLLDMVLNISGMTVTLIALHFFPKSIQWLRGIEKVES